jgi:hypothetical protein
MLVRVRLFQDLKKRFGRPAHGFVTVFIRFVADGLPRRPGIGTMLAISPSQ